MMSSFCHSRYLLALLLLNLYLQCVTADPNLIFLFKNFGKDSNFESQLALYGDAKVASDSTSVQITGSRAGGIVAKKPINLVEGRSRNMVSFSNYFVFSMSKEKRNGLAFVMLPVGLPLGALDSGLIGAWGDKNMKFLAVEFDAFNDDKYGDINGDHVGIDVNSLVSVKVSNVSSVNLVLNSGEKVQAWIDYEASGKMLEVRLSKLGDKRPLYPLLFYPIDLSRMWKDEGITVGLSALSGNSPQKCNIHTWSFRSRVAPHWMHSRPLDPEGFVEKQEVRKVSKRIHCALQMLVILIFATGCGALGAYLVLYVWKFFGNRRPVVPEEIALQHKEFEYNKLNVAIAKTIQDDKH